MSSLINLSVRVLAPNPSQDADPNRALQGEIGVHISRACLCEALTVSAEWSADPLPVPPPTEPMSGSIPAVMLFQSAWTPGVYHYPFTLARPALDLPLRWVVTARAEFSSASARGSQQVALQTQTPDSRGTLPPPKALNTAPFWRDKFVLMVLGGLGGAWLLFLIIIGFVSGWGSPPWLGTLIAPFAVAALVGLMWLFHHIRAQVIIDTLGVPVLSISPDQAPLGGQVEVTLTLNPPKTVPLHSVKAYLLCLERYEVRVHRKGLGVASISTQSTETRERELHRSYCAFDLPPQRTLTANEPLTLRQTLEIPANTSPPSGPNTRWCVQAVVRLPNCPDWTDERPLYAMTLERFEKQGTTGSRV